MNSADPARSSLKWFSNLQIYASPQVFEKIAVGNNLGRRKIPNPAWGAAVSCEPTSTVPVSITFNLFLTVFLWNEGHLKMGALFLLTHLQSP